MIRKFLITIVLVLVSINVYAFQIPPDDGKSIHDFAKIIKPASVAKIESMIASTTLQFPEVKISVMTVSDLEGVTIKQYAQEVIDTWGGDRVLLLIASSEKQVRLTVTKNLTGILTDNIIQEILETSKKFRGKRAEVIIGYVTERIKASNYLKPINTTSDVAFKPDTYMRTDYHSRVEKKPKLPTFFWYFAAFAVGMPIIAILYRMCQERRRRCWKLIEHCEHTINKIRATYELSQERLASIKATNHESVWESYKDMNTLPELSMYQLQLNTVKKRAQAFYVKANLEKACEIIKDGLDDIYGLCTCINLLHERITTAKDRCVELYSKDIPLLIDSIRRDIEKGDVPESFQQSYERLVEEYVLNRFDLNDANARWTDLRNRLDRIVKSLKDIDSEIREHRIAEIEQIKEVTKAKEVVSRLSHELPKRLKEAEGMATTEQLRRKLEEARFEYERAMDMQSLSSSNVIDWILISSMLTNATHQCITVFMQESSYPRTSPISIAPINTESSTLYIDGTSTTSSLSSDDSSNSSDSSSGATSSWSSDD